VFAYGVRVGLLRRREGEDFRSEQFKTGGGTTVRGFNQDRLGPLDQAGNPTGGDGVLILNSELRFPVYKFFEGVGFVDAGNVYRRLGEFDPFDLRASYGFGLRVRTPYILLRFDFGLNMNRRPTEPQGKFFFSIGQAF
jgi:outer membrane protein insertion porin family